MTEFQHHLNKINRDINQYLVSDENDRMFSPETPGRNVHHIVTNTNVVASIPSWAINRIFQLMKCSENILIQFMRDAGWSYIYLNHNSKVEFTTIEDTKLVFDITLDKMTIRAMGLTESEVSSHLEGQYILTSVWDHAHELGLREERAAQAFRNMSVMGDLVGGYFITMEEGKHVLKTILRTGYYNYVLVELVLKGNKYS